MSLQSITNINVDFYDKQYILVNAKQYDKSSRFLLVTCYNHGTLFSVNISEHSAYIRYKKSDDYSVFNFCEITDEGKVLIELTEQMLASDGICYAELVIVNRGSAKVDAETGEIITIDSASILSTMIFCIDVSETAVGNAEIESSYEYNGLNTALEKAEAEYSEVIRLSKSYAIGNAGGIRENEDADNAKYYYEQSLENADNASQSEINAAKSEQNAKISETNASKSENSAKTSATNAKTYMDKSEEYMNGAKASETGAEASENAAKGYAATAQNSMNSAENSASSASTSATNAYNYYLQAEAITNGLNGAFLPKGTITFAELLELKDGGMVAAGDLYQISDDFTTDENFRVSGKVCGAGTSVYYTVDDQFDCFVGATVAGVKGENETEYRTGMVNITPENIGAVSNADVATVDEMKNYLGI
jgi:hypothetical protein